MSDTDDDLMADQNWQSLPDDTDTSLCTIFFARINGNDIIPPEIVDSPILNELTGIELALIGSKDIHTFLEEITPYSLLQISDQVLADIVLNPDGLQCNINELNPSLSELTKRFEHIVQHVINIYKKNGGGEGYHQAVDITLKRLAGLESYCIHQHRSSAQLNGRPQYYLNAATQFKFIIGHIKQFLYS